MIKSDEDNLSDSSSKKSKEEEEEKDLQFYGDEDLYYKEEKLKLNEIKDIKENIKILRLKLLKFFKNKEETVNNIIKRIKPKVIPKKNLPTINKRKNTPVNLENTLKIEDNKKNEENFKELLELISKLTELSHFDIYEDSYNKLVKDYGEGYLIKWKYRIIQNKKDDSDIINEYGEFTTNQILEWENNVNNFIKIRNFLLMAKK